MKYLKQQLSKLSIPIQDLSYFLSNYRLDSLKILLITLCAILYLPHAFILNEDLGIMMAYETDPGIAAQSILGLLDNYNFHEHHYSRHYGWTYYFINNILLSPVKIFIDIFDFRDSHRFLLTLIKIIFFAIGLLSMLVFHEILLKLFSNRSLIALGSLFYVLGDVAYIFYFIHPESTGLLFTFLGILFLLKFLENPKYKYYIYGLIFLTASALTKQIFAFTSLPILVIFITSLLKNENKNIVDLLKSKIFFNFVKHSILVVFITLLLINPFLIFDFKNAISYQAELVNIHNQDGFLFKLLTHEELIKYWPLLISFLPIAFIYFVLSPLTFACSAYLACKYRDKNCTLFLVMICSIYIIFLLTISNNRLYITDLYLVPLYPFLILHALTLLNYVSKFNSKKLRMISIIFLWMFFALSLLKSTELSIARSIDRLFGHKSSIIYETHEFIMQNMNEDDKVVHDQFTAMPYKMRKTACNAWTNESCVEKFDPDYAIIYEDFKTNEEGNRRLDKVINLIKEKKMVLYHKIEDCHGGDLQIIIYKRKGIKTKPIRRSPDNCASIL